MNVDLIGHATLLAQTSQASIIFDPVLAERGEPSSP